MAEVDLSVPDMPPKERRDKLAALAALHASWVQSQLAGAPFHPEGRPAGSDYNQHYVDLEVDDSEFQRQAKAIFNP